MRIMNVCGVGEGALKNTKANYFCLPEKQRLPQKSDSLIAQ